MIEDKDLGVKIAENKEEIFWRTMLENTEKRIVETTAEVEIHNAVLKLCKKKLREFEGININFDA